MLVRRVCEGSTRATVGAAQRSPTFESYREAGPVHATRFGQGGEGTVLVSYTADHSSTHLAQDTHPARPPYATIRPGHCMPPSGPATVCHHPTRPLYEYATTRPGHCGSGTEDIKGGTRGQHSLIWPRRCKVRKSISLPDPQQGATAPPSCLSELCSTEAQNHHNFKLKSTKQVKSRQQPPNNSTPVHLSKQDGFWKSVALYQHVSPGGGLAVVVCQCGGEGGRL
ncbi:hypothetical protein O3P69_017961 [Scylla paramamosain]|uniref:Uncharacterized protein n=1 Tax=Scylla paramamosain TaxID=85552 RepID=A0AAW0TGW6_SCYPA